MRTSLLLAVFGLFALLSVHAHELGFSGNVSYTGQGNGDYDFRSTSLLTWAGLASSGAYFSSISTGKTKHSAEGDALWGAAYVSFGGVPLSWLGYWSNNVTFGHQTDYETVDASGSAGFLATGYLAIVEKDENDTVVVTQSLKAGLGGKTVQWEGDVSASQNGSLKWVSFSGNQQGEDWNITITFIVSDVIGVVNWGAVVSPKSLESIIEINNWPYKNSNNTLSLVLGVASGAAFVDKNTFISGSNSSQVYFTLSDYAVVNKTYKGVKVSAYVDADVNTNFADPNILANLQGRYKSALSSKLVTVEFPAGASHIIYDPAAGAGTPITYDDPSPTSAPTTTPSPTSAPTTTPAGPTSSPAGPTSSPSGVSGASSLVSFSVVAAVVVMMFSLLF